jgi:hypothetical protein
LFWRNQQSEIGCADLCALKSEVSVADVDIRAAGEFQATGAAFADDLTPDNEFQWPTDTRFEPLKPPALASPPPTVVDQIVNTYEKMPVRPAYLPASNANGHGGFGLQFHRVF